MDHPESNLTTEHLITLILSGVDVNLDVVPEEALPDWYVSQIKFLAQDKFRVSWLGQYVATEEPCPAIDRLELSTWMDFFTDSKRNLPSALTTEYPEVPAGEDWYPKGPFTMGLSQRPNPGLCP